MPDLPSHTIRLADLTARTATDILLEPDAGARAALASALGIPAIRKLRFDARLAPRGKRDWVLRADLGATVVQDCVATLAPVTTRIDETVTRSYLADYATPEGGEVEMPEDDTAEPLPDSLELYDVLHEALALALPPFPRADGAEPAVTAVTEPGKTPMTDDDARPFAGLAGLRDRLAGEPGDET